MVIHSVVAILPNTLQVRVEWDGWNHPNERDLKVYATGAAGAHWAGHETMGATVAEWFARADSYTPLAESADTSGAMAATVWVEVA